MEKITLQPGEWTPFHHNRRFQVAGQHSVRMGLGSGIGPANGGTYSPPIAGAPYFTTQGYDPKIIDPLELLGLDSLNSSSHIYLMPEGNRAVDIVAL